MMKQSAELTNKHEGCIKDRTDITQDALRIGAAAHE